MPKKKIKAIKEAITKSKIITGENPRIAHFRKLMAETPYPGKKAEYKFWIETMEGKNPSVPDHMK